MSNIVGSIRRVTLNGRTYDVYVDTNVTINFSVYEKEGQATSGDTLIKMTKRVPIIEGLDLATTTKEAAGALKTMGESVVSVPISIELADASILRGTGHINFESYESETGKSTNTLIPDKDWTFFEA